jgi:hypothetical protein
VKKKVSKTKSSKSTLALCRLPTTVNIRLKLLSLSNLLFQLKKEV